MTDVFSYDAGAAALLISVPHDGREIPATIEARMTAEGLSMPDTDWHVAQLYRFAGEVGAHILTAKYSRYVVDLNRSADDGVLYPGQAVTGLCPQQTFSGDAIYSRAGPNEREVEQRIAQYWQPYHEKIRSTLASIRAQHGYALLWDAHSIRSTVPLLFDGELPRFNLGSNDGNSCAGALANDVVAVMRKNCDNSVLNGRFKGGYITREYGDPDNHVHALQLEISQRAYMHERTLQFDTELAAATRHHLRAMIDAFVQSAKRNCKVQ